MTEIKCDLIVKDTNLKRAVAAELLQEDVSEEEAEKILEEYTLERRIPANSGTS